VILPAGVLSRERLAVRRLPQSLYCCDHELLLSHSKVIDWEGMVQMQDMLLTLTTCFRRNTQRFNSNRLWRGISTIDNSIVANRASCVHIVHVKVLSRKLTMIMARLHPELPWAANNTVPSFVSR